MEEDHMKFRGPNTVPFTVPFLGQLTPCCIDETRCNKIQQDDNYKEFMGTITDGGLRYAYAVKMRDPMAPFCRQREVRKKQRKNIIVVGAGVSGLAAAYELAQNGHKVTILEAQSRVGGRVKTLREGFQDGLHCEGGAMRLPYNHYLTKHYIDLFEVETRPFQNENDDGYLYIYGDKIRISEWKSNNAYWTDKWFPGWDANIPECIKDDVDGILDLYDRTVKPVKDELGKHPNKQEWRSFIEKWSVLSLEEFLRSTIHQDPDDIKLRPWPEEAIMAYKVTSYRTQGDSDLVSFLRDELGEWWKDPLYTPTYGMDTLPKSMVKNSTNGWNKKVNLSKNIVFGIMVDKVEVFENDTEDEQQVKVSGVNASSGAYHEYVGDAVIITVPLNILRQIDIPSFTIDKRKALSGVTYEASTKIMLQCKTRFWQNDVGQGGFSKTDMPIGQLHYPDHADSGIPDDARGILLVYTWGRDALTFGAETKQLAISNAIKEISKIHPEIVNEFEVGNIQAWFSDPSSQGAYAQLKPFEYLDSMKTLTTPSKGIYLAGEALSWSNGWIQGAIFSGLRAAYQLTANSVDPKDILHCDIL